MFVLRVLLQLPRADNRWSVGVVESSRRSLVKVLVLGARGTLTQPHAGEMKNHSTCVGKCSASRFGETNGKRDTSLLVEPS